MDFEESQASRSMGASSFVVSSNKGDKAEEAAGRTSYLLLFHAFLFLFTYSTCVSVKPLTR